MYVGIWYEIMICANTDQIHDFFSRFVPIMTPIYSPIPAQYKQIQAYISSNTDHYKHQYRPMHTSLFSILATLHVNTGIGTVKSGSPASSAAPLLPVCQRYLNLPSGTLQHEQLLLVVCIQFLGVVRQPNFPSSPAANFSSADSGECRFIAVCLVARIAVNAHSSESSD